MIRRLLLVLLAIAMVAGLLILTGCSRRQPSATTGATTAPTT